MATANSIIAGSLRLIGVLAEGENVNSDTANDCLTAFNQLLDSWSAERLAVYSTQDQVFSWLPTYATRTLGPSGNFVGNRPVQVDDATYFKANNVSYGLTLINQQQYDAIAVKTATSTYPQVMFVNYDMPNITMTVYPVPTTTLEMHIISVQELTQPAAVGDTLSFPPGYLRAFRFGLACELAPEFGLEAPPTVKRMADIAKRTIKRINNPDDKMTLPYPMVSRQSRYNIFSNT